MNSYIDPLIKKGTWTCAKHKVKIVEGLKCPFCLEEAKFPKRIIFKEKRGSLNCKVCGKKIKHRNWQAEVCLKCLYK
jgi:predicted amidophosphoribosyltransferase